MPSILDRLIDHEPGVSTEPASRHIQSLSEYRQGVLRDIENLLNSRQQYSQLPPGCPELLQSMLTYGLPDFTSAGVGSAEEQEQLRHAVELSIRRFEPRLRHVRVTLHHPEDQFERSLRLTIDALLMVEPNPEPIMFDTVVQPSSGTCKVQ